MKRLFGALLFLLISLDKICFAKTIDYTAEHLIESPMNARYLSFPLTPKDLSLHEKRAAVGILNISAEKFTSLILLLSVDSYLPTSEKNGWIFSSFLDVSQIGGQTGDASSHPNYINQPAFTTPLLINISDIHGWSYHVGVSAAYTHRLFTNWSMQYGLAIESLNVRNFQVDFVTTNQTANFAGQINYAGSYSMATPYLSANYRFTMAHFEKDFIFRMIAANPLPKSGFKGRFDGGGTSQGSDSYSVGLGKHIPDPFVGLGLAVEDPKSGWRADIGATIYMFLAEGTFFHKGLGHPVFLNISRSF